jgi:recombination protein RecA
MVKTADEAMDMTVQCVSTGFPQLDRILRPVNGGWPRGRHAEVYSRREQSGKSSLMIQAAAAFQQAGLTCALANIENASTVEFFNALGLSTDVNHPTLCAPLLIGDMVGQLSAEEYLQAVKDTSSIVDFIGVDSVAAMDTAANLANSSYQSR